jgi:hypothetical protein
MHYRKLRTVQFPHTHQRTIHMKKFLGLAVILSMVCALAFAQDKTTVQKPATTTPAKVEGVEKAMKDDCCSGEKVKEKAEGCGTGRGECTGKSKGTENTKSTTGAAKAKTTTAPKAK